MPTSGEIGNPMASGRLRRPRARRSRLSSRRTNVASKPRLLDAWRLARALGKLDPQRSFLFAGITIRRSSLPHLSFSRSTISARHLLPREQQSAHGVTTQL